MTDKNIQEAPVGSGTAIADKSSEKRAQISLKMIQLRMKQNKERASLAAQRKSLQKEETMNESFSASQIAALKAEYSKINTVDPDSDTYKKLIAMLDRLDLKSLQSLAGAEVKFVSKLAQNRVLRKSMKKEDVQLDELSNDKLADYKKKAGADASAADKAGDMKRGNKRFSGIMKATRKQFGNDAKQKTEELSPKQKEIDKNKNGKIDGFDLAHLRKKNEELSPKQKELDKNKNGKIDGTDLAHLRSKKKLPQGADFAAQRRKERLASTGRMDEEVKVGDKVSFNHPMKAIPGKTMKKVGTVHKVEDDTVHVKVKDKYGVITHKKTASELTKEEFNIGEESINEKSDYEVYHKDYSGAVQAAIKQAEKRGYEVDMDDWHDKVATGPKKPSSGKTNSFSVNLMKDGKPSKKKLQMQVYNMDDHKYELNMYIEEVQQGVAEAAKWRTHTDAHDLDTDGSYIPKGGIKSDNLAIRQQASKTQSEKDPKSMAGMFGAKYAKKHGVPTKQLMKNIPLDAKKKEQGVAEGSVDKKPYPKTWHDVDPKIGKLVDKMSPEEKVKKGYSNPSILKKKKEQGVAEAFPNPGSGSTGSSKEDKRIAAALRKKHIPSTPNDKKKGVAEEVQELDELNKDTLHSYAKKSEKDQDDQFNKIGKGIRDNDPKSANKAGHKFSMRSIGQNRAEKRLAKEAASPAQQAAIAIAMKKAGKKPKDMKEGIVDKIKAIKRGMQAKAKADDHFDKAGDPKNANASKDLKKAVRYHNLLNKEEVVLEAKKSKTFKNIKKKMKEEETPNKSTIKKGDILTGKREPIEINPELKEPTR